MSAFESKVYLGHYTAHVPSYQSAESTAGTTDYQVRNKKTKTVLCGVFVCGRGSTAIKRPSWRFLFYLVGFYLILSGNMGKDV